MPSRSLYRVFLLSPARANGRRAQMLVRPEASFELARQVQIGGASLGDVFTFCSGLYFRGKLAYARRFAHPPPGVAGELIITPSRGVLPADTSVGMEMLREFAEVPIDPGDLRFTTPLIESVKLLAALPSLEIVLLGSIATGKYVDVLLPFLAKSLLFPAEFVGRGDMSRGGLMLRRAAVGEELRYIPVAGAVRHGARPAKLSFLRFTPLVRE